MHGAGVAIIIILLLLVAAGVGWIVFARMRAQRLGLPPPPLSSYIPFLKSSSGPYGGPQPAPGGVVGWFNDRVRAFKNRNNRTAVGAYESSTGGGAPGTQSRGFGPLDPDDAWDSRVGNEPDPYSGAGSGQGGYYEEQELRNQTHPAYGGGSRSAGGDGYQMNLPYDEEERRGRGRSRSPAPGPAKNPFGEGAEPSNLSMRGVSPRPIDTGVGGPRKGAKDDDSPSERRSVFRENV